MVNEHVYCPRLFFYEFVDGLFRDSVDTVEGSTQHKRVDSGTGALPSDADTEEKIHSRSVTLASERFKAIAKMDLVEVQNGIVTPVDYKHGKPRLGPDGELEMWPPDRVQLGIQGLILVENGYRVEEVVAYYSKTKQKARVAFDEALIAETEAAIAQTWETARAGVMPRPLVDSPKCPGCSMVGICLPDETNWLLRQAESFEGPEQLELFEGEQASPQRRPMAREMRQMVTPRSEQKAVYLNTQGLRVGKSGEVLQVKEKDTVVQQIRLGEVGQLNVMGNIQVTTQATQALCEAGAPICYFSMGGWFYGVTSGMNTKNVFLRRSQFRLAESEGFCVSLARKLVAGKIRNQRVLLQRNHMEPRALALAALKQSAEDA
jgi:CRISPR-associated protein Cas1